ncbi:unnamed protein product [Paramecium octaurelia]|uniref:Ankyrin repeat-containing domain n=1 Tax=Paramecium octaurelia TaxID=43137 RepID=A0A8S1TR27_PAROT|nr:unnamed protein product [Paramecium octaurelia]
MNYQPIQIETQQYKYYVGNQEKSFQIKKKAEFFQYQRFKTVSNSFHETNNCQEKKQKQRRMTLDRCQECSNEDVKQIKEKNSDKKLMRKQVKVTNFEDLLLQYQKSFRQRQMKKKVLEALEQEPLYFKGSSTNNNQMKNSQQDHTQQKNKKSQNINKDQQLQDKIQNYLSRKSVNLQRLSQKMDDFNLQRKLTKQSDSIERQIKTQTNFFEDFADSDLSFKNQEKDDYSELLKQSYKYWDFAIKTKKDPTKVRKTECNISISTQTNLEKMKSLLLFCIRKLKFMKLHPEIILKNNEIIKLKPYQREGSYVFFKAIGKNDLDLVKLMLEKCRFYAFDVNEYFQTALHICSRKGYMAIAEILLSYGTYPDAKDVNYKTPLYYALVNKQKDIVKLLLIQQCNPWSSKGCIYETNDPCLMKILKIARRIDLLLMMIPYKKRQQTWMNCGRVIQDL